MNNFGLRLKKLRESRGLSIGELAKIVNTNPLVIQYWENNKRYLRIGNLIKLAQYFNVSTDYLVGL